ncbi:MAG: hypothetical protein HOK52_05790 [Candidatus Marinimicrobia bacterium]|jgi:hypothetical protein|nr:hypothetical protein [Candidatus Neomarinimicrobiota bacterium]
MNNKTYIIAEIGINHKGDIDICKEMIRTSARCGVDAAKSKGATDVSLFQCTSVYPTPFEEVNLLAIGWWPRIVVGVYGKNSQIETTTLLRQELIEHGIFTGGSFNLSIAHSDKGIIAETLLGIRQSFEKFSTYLKTANTMSNLRGELIKPVFQVR